MRQIPLAIGFDPAHSFENFVPGENQPVLEHLRCVTRQSAPVYLWGASGSGKTHLLQALANAWQAAGESVGWFTPADPPPWAHGEARTLIVLDDCDSLGAEQQHAAFALFVEASMGGVAVVSAGRVPPVDLALRADLRSRLGWGVVFALQPLPESEARAVLRREADQHGIFLSDEVMDYLLTRFARDLKHLMALLERLDEFAMATKRAVTVPLLKQMLSEGG